MKISSVKKYSGGQVMLTAVIFFLLLSTTIVFGVAGPIMKQVATEQEHLKSKESYYAAESALEDMVYRVKNNIAAAATESMTLNNSTVFMANSATILGRQVTVTSDRTGVVRKLQATLVRGTGVAFKYGTQAGQGGMYFGNNAVLKGTLYANGDITGENGSIITGDAFVAGATGLIDGLKIGTNGVGSAHAHTVTNSKVGGTLYCKTGSGNKDLDGNAKTCNTTETEPAAIALPISDEDITGWEADAVAGGVTTGDTTISSPTTLGPRKIEGNLTINNTLTLTNTLWVTGNILIKNTVKLAPSYGASSGVIIADGYIIIDNGVVFQNSGTAGSYILLLSNSTCDATAGSPCNGNYAIGIGNNSTVIIANAQKGTIYFSNNSSVKESVGNKIRLKNNSTIDYGTGIASANFTSGAAGGYDLTDWSEIQ